MGVFFSLFYLAICASQFCIGPLSDSFGRMKFMISGLVISSFGFFSFPFFDSWMIIAILVLISFGFGGFYLTSLTYLNEIVPSWQRGIISGVYFLFWGIGYFSGPLIIGRIENFFGPGYGFCTFAFLILSLAVCLLFAENA